MADVLFRNPPHPKLLQQLAKGLLEQNHHLTRAVRLWALLRWLYGDKGYTALPDCFTYADWRESDFFRGRWSSCENIAELGPFRQNVVSTGSTASIVEIYLGLWPNSHFRQCWKKINAHLLTN